MARYNSTSISRDKRRKFRVYKPTIYPSIPMKDSDIFIAPIVGEKLENLAHRYYSDFTLWWIIAKANNITDTTVISNKLKRVRIPTEIQDVLQKLDELTY
jgi:hypothetical protein